MASSAPGTAGIVHIGIWLELPPGGHLVGEGIGQLVRLIAENTCSWGTKCTFFAPFWLRETLERYLNDFKVEARESISVQYTRRMVPLLWKFSGQAGRGRRGWQPWWWARLDWRPLARNIVRLVVSRSTPTAVLIVLLGLPLIVAALPFAAAGLGLLWLVHRLSGMVARGRLRLKNMRERYGRLAYELIREDEYERMVQSANRRTDIDCWFIPSPGWSTAAKLRGPKVCLFPDFVFAEHWTGFTAHAISELRRQFSALARSRPHYVCFSRHVMEVHAQRYFGIPKSLLSLIHHAPILYEAPADNQGRETLMRYLAEHFVHEDAGSNIEQQHIHPYLRSLDLSNLRYIFVSTQLRPYKNVLRLVQAVERLIRYHHIEVKLILTGTLDFTRMDTDVTKFIQTNALWFDILSIPRVPKHIHALLYRFAALTVHPSFFEGGFPFVFGESVGLGTPCLLARNAAVAELLSRSELRSFTFDPYLAPDRLAVVLIEALERRESMLAEQKATLSRMSTSTWQDVSLEYFRVFAAAAAANHAPRRGYTHRSAAATSGSAA